MFWGLAVFAEVEESNWILENLVTRFGAVNLPIHTWDIYAAEDTLSPRIEQREEQSELTEV